MNRITRWLKSRRLAQLKQQRAGLKAWLSYAEQPGFVPSPQSYGLIADAHQLLGEIEEKIRQLEVV